MAMINIKEGTLVFVPWRIQGIVRNEERQLNYSIHLLEKQNKYTLNCITRNQNMAINKLARFSEKLNNTPRVSAIMDKARKTREAVRTAAINRRPAAMTRRPATMTRKPAAMTRSKPWEPSKLLPAGQKTAPPLRSQISQRTGFLPRGQQEKKAPEWPPLPTAMPKKTSQWQSLALLKRAAST